MWRKYNTFSGMKVRLVTFHTTGTAYKNSKSQWYIKWDSGGKTASGDCCGIKDGEIHQIWTVVELEQTQELSGFISCDEIKIANTSVNSTNCIKCSGPLKDLGMGPQFKFCPICEP